jgi:hypothetical protein
MNLPSLTKYYVEVASSGHVTDKPMVKGNSDTSQLRFENGELIEETTDDRYTVDPVEPGDDTGYAVEVKPGALGVNSELRETVEHRGHTLEFGSRARAEDYARQLSATGGELKIQAAPANEPDEIDAYLLAGHSPSIKKPAAVDGDTWTFDVGANLYGSLGEAILLHSPKPHALVYFVRQDLELDEGKLEWGLNVEVAAAEPQAIKHSGGPKRWTPDCVIEARDGWGGETLETYYCEIKTGDASFERSQVETMEALAREERVLKIRVDIENLPDEYSLRIHEVEPQAETVR